MYVLCNDLYLLLNPTKTQEMQFSTRYVKPCTPGFALNDTIRVLSDKVKYLGVMVDDSPQYRQPPKEWTCKEFCIFSFKSLSVMLSKSFIISLISYCLPVIFTCLYASDMKSMRQIFNDATKLG